MELTRYAEGKDEAINVQGTETVAFSDCGKLKLELEASVRFEFKL